MVLSKNDIRLVQISLNDQRRGLSSGAEQGRLPGLPGYIFGCGASKFGCFAQVYQQGGQQFFCGFGPLLQSSKAASCVIQVFFFIFLMIIIMVINTIFIMNMFIRTGLSMLSPLLSIIVAITAVQCGWGGGNVSESAHTWTGATLHKVNILISEQSDDDHFLEIKTLISAMKKSGTFSRIQHSNPRLYNGSWVFAALSSQVPYPIQYPLPQHHHQPHFQHSCILPYLIM